MIFGLYSMLLVGMVALAVIVFISLYFVKAGYGMFRTKQWGWSLDNRLAWVLMEAPAFFAIIAVVALMPHNASHDILMNPEDGYFGGTFCASQCVLLALFLLHYFQRSFIFPFLMTGKSRMPVAIMLMGVVFNCINAVMQGAGLFWWPDFTLHKLYLGDGTMWLLPLQLPLAEWLMQPYVILGLAVFFVGMAINLHSDHVIRHLRQPGDTKHYLPAKGMYKYVTSANYFGELVEWTGFAIAAMTPAAWVFVIWTAANLVPRSHAIHRRYREEFGEAVGNRKRIIPFVY